MKTILVSILFIAGSFAVQGQTKQADSTKSARDYIIENENKRTTTPNKVKREIKTISPSEVKQQPETKQKATKCCLFCKKKKKTS